MIDRQNNVQLSRNFSSEEFLSDKDTNRYGIVHPALISLLQAIRNEYDAPIGINSGYRTPEHNARIGGASASTHLFGMGADLRGQNLQLIEALAKKHGAGGIKRYNTFVHVDIWTPRTW